MPAEQNVNFAAAATTKAEEALIKFMSHILTEKKK